MIGKKNPNWVDLVREFQKETGQGAPRRLQLRPKKEAVMRLNLLHSEVAELMRAEQRGDMAQVAHELADVLYVTIGTAVQYGINIDPVFSEVHRANMAKRWADGKFHAHRGTGKIQKPKGWTPPDVTGVLKGYKATKA